MHVQVIAHAGPPKYAMYISKYPTNPSKYRYPSKYPVYPFKYPTCPSKYPLYIQISNVPFTHSASTVPGKHIQGHEGHGQSRLRALVPYWARKAQYLRRARLPQAWLRPKSGWGMAMSALNENQHLNVLSFSVNIPKSNQFITKMATEARETVICITFCNQSTHGPENGEGF